MTIMTVKAQLSTMYQQGDGPVALGFTALGEDGANDAWVTAAGPESTFKLEMNIRADVAEALGLRPGLRCTVALCVDSDRHAMVAPPEGTELTSSDTYLVHDTENGGLMEVDAAEARSRGYETGVGGASGLAVGPQQQAPLLSLPDDQLDDGADSATEHFRDDSDQLDDSDADYATGGVVTGGDVLGSDGGDYVPAPHGEVHDASDERSADDADAPVLSDEAHLSTEAEHDEHKAAE